MLIIYLCQTEIPSQGLLIDKEHYVGVHVATIILMLSIDINQTGSCAY